MVATIAERPSQRTESLNRTPANLTETIEIFDELFQRLEKGEVTSEVFGEFKIPDLTSEEIVELLTGDHQGQPKPAIHYIAEKKLPEVNPKLNASWNLGKFHTPNELLTSIEESLNQAKNIQEIVLFALALLLRNNSRETYQKICESIRKHTFYNRGRFAGVTGLLKGKTEDQTNAEQIIQELANAIKTENEEWAKTLESVYKEDYEKKPYSSILAKSESLKHRDQATRKIKGIDDQWKLSHVDQLDISIDYRLASSALNFLIERHENTTDEEMKPLFQSRWVSLFEKIKTPVELNYIKTTVEELAKKFPKSGKAILSYFETAFKKSLESPDFLWQCLKYQQNLDNKFIEILKANLIRHKKGLMKCFFQDPDIQTTNIILDFPENFRREIVDKLFNNFDPLKPHPLDYKRAAILKISSDWRSILKRALLHHPKLTTDKENIKNSVVKFLILAEKEPQEINQFLTELSEEIQKIEAYTSRRIEEERTKAAEAARAAADTKEREKKEQAKKEQESQAKPLRDFSAKARAAIKKLPPSTQKAASGLASIPAILQSKVDEILLEPELQTKVFAGKPEITRELEPNSPLRLLGATAIKLKPREGGGFDISLIVEENE